ncbi:unnamed protein product, partial [Mesorhabditis spiculigera]
MVIFALLTSLVVASPSRSAIDSQFVGFRRHRRDAAATCVLNRPFLCYVFDELVQEYPDWLKTDDPQKERTKCSPCAVADLEECWFGLFYFPFNLCTREMVASGQCEGKNLSGINYSPESIPHTTQYFLQCDAGFVIPQFVFAAHAADDDVQETCIPSLQLAAGYLQTDPTGLDKNPYDVFDPLQPNYCPKGGRQAGEKCNPLHICMPDPKAIKFFLGGSTVIKKAAECDEQCVFPRSDGQYLPESCVLLDITDPRDTPPYYTLRRALSGPYATLMSEEETIDLLESLRAQKQVSEGPAEQPVDPSKSEETSRVEENPQRQHGGRVKRQGSSLRPVSYPRCIKTDGLPEDQKAIVKADGLLDCEQNPFYKELGLESLTVTKFPLCSAVDANKKFCRTSAASQPTNPTATTPASEGDWLDPPEPWAMVSMVVACSGDALMIIAIALAWYIRFGRPEKDDDDDEDEEMDSHSRKHDSSKKKSGDDDDASAIDSQFAGFRRHRRDAAATCVLNRPFLCYVFDELVQEYPAWLKTDDPQKERTKEDQKAIVIADGLLDCEQNPFYKELGLESLTVTKLPLCSALDQNKKFCRTSADSQSTNPTATTPASEGDWLDPPEPWAMVSMVVACSGDALMIIAIALAWYIRFGRPEKDDDDDEDEEMDSHSRKHDSSKKKSGDDDDA